MCIATKIHFILTHSGNSVHIQLARANGAEIIENCAVMRLEPIAGDQCIVSYSLTQIVLNVMYVYK